MTPDQFRRFALRFTDALEKAHQGHPDFRVGTRIFATLGYPDVAFGMVKLTPEQQQLFMAAAPEAFAPSKGAWGAGGSTLVRLAAVAPAMLQDALTAAWHDAVAHVSKRTPKRVTSTSAASVGAARAKDATTRAKKRASPATHEKPAVKRAVAATRAKHSATIKTARPATSSTKRKTASKAVTKRPTKRASPRRNAGAKR